MRTPDMKMAYSTTTKILVKPAMNAVRHLILPFGCLVFAAMMQPGRVSAVSPNDDFASAAVLSSGVQEEIDNTGNTLEVGEPIPSGFTASTYQATAWWNFSPAAFDNWYEIDTTGSTVDTVLTIWAGDDFSTPLTLVHVNDEASGGSVSRIRYFFSSSVNYQISVASRTGARGTIKIQASSLPDPFAVVTGASFAPVNPNVGGGAANMTATVTIEAGREIHTGLFSVFSPTGTLITTTPVSGAGNRISGSVAFGTYSIPFTIPAYSPGGAYRWSLFVHTNSPTSTPDSSYGWEAMTPLPVGAPKTFNVVNNPFAAWVALNGLIGLNATRDADPDKDGLSNLIEYQSGLNPQVASLPSVTVSGASITQAGLPQITVTGTGSQRRLRMIYLRRLGDPTVTGTAQFSDNVINWSNATQSATVIATSATHEAVVVEDEIFVPARDWRFGRVNYVYTP